MRVGKAVTRNCVNSSAHNSRFSQCKWVSTWSLSSTKCDVDIAIPATDHKQKYLSAKSLNTNKNMRYQHEGEIIFWNPYERRGAIRDYKSKEVFAIANSFAFETILPTSMPALEGAKVTFTKHNEPNKAQVIVRYRNEPITAESYNHTTPPVSLLDDCVALGVKEKKIDRDCLESGEKEEVEQVEENERLHTESDKAQRSVSSTSESQLSEIVSSDLSINNLSIAGYAADIVVDLNSISHTQLSRFDGPLVRMEGVAPTSNVKDLRNIRLFDRTTNDYLRYKRILGSEAAAREACAQQHAQERVQNKKYERIIVQREVFGTITAWSPLHRSGVIVKTESTENAEENQIGSTMYEEMDKNEVNQEIKTKTESCEELQDTIIALNETKEHRLTDNTTTAKTNTGNICIIRNAFSFTSALPTSTNLVDKTVTFVEVVYPIRPQDHYAEEICINGPHVFDAALPSVEEVQTKVTQSRKAEQLVRRHRARGVVIMDMENDAVNVTQASSSPPSRNNTETENASSAQESSLQHDEYESHYGVITRWSGGSGVVQSEVNKHYEIPSSAQFDTLISNTHFDNHHICGAVVMFKVNSAQPHIACNIEVISTPESNTPSVLRSQAERVHEKIKKEYHVRRLANTEEDNDKTCKKNETFEVEEEEYEEEEECSNGLVHYGVLRSWFAEERQGIISGDDGNHYVIRDAAEDVLEYKLKCKKLQCGVNVKFMTNGMDSRLALQVEIIADEHYTSGNNDTAELNIEKSYNDNNMSESQEVPNEAIASPLSVNYWLHRMERVGLNVKDIRDRQGRALTLNEFIDDDSDDDDDDEEDSSNNKEYDAHMYATEGYANKRAKMQQKENKQGSSSSKKVGVKEKEEFQDTLTLLTNDPWWNDSRRNLKLNDSGITAGTLAMLSPAAALNTALSINTPKKLNKVLKKVQSKLTEEQKAIAWEQAKEQAPLFVKHIKEQREREDDTTTYWF